MDKFEAEEENNNDDDDDATANKSKKGEKFGIRKNVKKETKKIEVKSSDSSLSSTKAAKRTKFDSLKDINLEVKKGEFIIVVGPIGSGKSSLLQALAGFMEQTSGDLKVNGDLILSTVPWIKNDTIRENIIFGLLFEKEKYQTVITACALGEDFK